MAIDAETISRITILARTEGVDKAASELKTLASAQDGVAATSEKTSRANLSAEKSYDGLQRRVDATHRAQKAFENDVRTLTQAQAQGLIPSQQRLNELLALSAQRYNQTVAATGAAAAAAGKYSQGVDLVGRRSGAAGGSLANLSFQINDIASGLAMGQSPFTIMAQQGGQVFQIWQQNNDVFKQFGSFLVNAAGWAGRFALSTGGVITGVIGIGAAALYMGSSFASAQKEIDRALSGTGAASGLNRGGINRIADRASSSAGLSISEAREAATAVAATGKIYGDNVERATLLTKDFARAMGIDASEATKRLAKDLQDPVAAALEWNRTLGFLDSKTLDHIRSLVAMGQRQEAVNALMAAAAPSLGKMAQNVDIVTRAYDAFGNAISDTFEKWKAFAARSLEKTTGANLGAFSDEDRLTLLRQRRDERSRGPFAQGLDAGPIRELNKEIAELEKKLQGAAAAASETRFNQLSLQANEFTRSLIPSIEQVEKLTQAISTLDQYQAGRLSRGLGADPQAESALAVARMQLSIAMELEGVEVRKAQVFAQNALAYQNVSASTAQVLAQMESQLGVAQAITGAAQIEAQHRATINALLAQGKALVDAIAIADAQRAISLAQVNAEADRTLINLQQQGELTRAISEEERGRIRAAQTYNDLIERGVDAQKAGAVAAQMQANARLDQIAREMAQAEQDAARAAQQHASAAQAAAAASERTAQAAAEAQRRWEAAAASLRFLPFYLLDTLGAMDKLFNSNQTGKSQFNPEGYTSKAPTPMALISSRKYGPNGVDSSGQPTAAGMQFYFDAMLQKSGGNLGVAVNSLLGGGLMTAGGLGSRAVLDSNRVSLLNRAIDILPQNQQVAAIQQEIGLLGSAPPSLESAELIKQLNDKLRQLTEATEENTAATSVMTDVLSPFYSSDPRRTHLGFRAFASGGIMTKYGELPLQSFATGGITSKPSLFQTSENYQPEAIIPLQNGAVPVRLLSAANSNQPQRQTDASPPIYVVQNFYGNVDSDDMRRTGYQMMQQMRSQMAG